MFGPNAKYISFSLDGEFPEKYMVFDTPIDHGDVANMLKEKWPGFKIVSAGFVKVQSVEGRLEAVPSGKSTSLSIGQHHMDSQFLTRMLVAD